MPLNKLAKAQSILTQGVWNSVCHEIAASYTFESHGVSAIENFHWMEQMLLSPRSSYINFNDHCKNDGFCVCAKCLYSLSCNEITRFAIANNYIFGTAPL